MTRNSPGARRARTPSSRSSTRCGYAVRPSADSVPRSVTGSTCRGDAGERVGVVERRRRGGEPPRRRRPAAGRPCAPSRTATAWRPRRGTARPGARRRPARPSSAGPVGRVVVRRRAPRTSAARAVGRPPTRGGDHRRAAGLGLDRDQPERLVVRRDGDQVGGCGTTATRRGAVDRRHEPDLRLDAQRGRRARCSSSGCARPVPLGPPSDGDDEPVERSSGRRASSSAAARSSTSGAFSGWIRPTNSSTTASAGRPTRGAGPRRWSPGVKTSRSTPGGTDAHPGGVGVVQLDQLARLLVGVGDQPVGGLDDLGLADLAAGRLGACHPSASVGVLDPRHRVHRVHQRHAASGRRPASRPGRRASSGSGRGRTSPRAARASARITPAANAHSCPGRSCLAQPLVRPGGDVAHDDPGRELDCSAGSPPRGRPGEDVDLDAARGPGAWRSPRRRRSGRPRPPSPGCSSGEVCTLSIAMRRSPGAAVMRPPGAGLGAVRV